MEIWLRRLLCVHLALKYRPYLADYAIRLDSKSPFRPRGPDLWSFSGAFSRLFHSDGLGQGGQQGVDPGVQSLSLPSCPHLLRSQTFFIISVFNKASLERLIVWLAYLDSLIGAFGKFLATITFGIVGSSLPSVQRSPVSRNQLLTHYLSRIRCRRL